MFPEHASWLRIIRRAWPYARPVVKVGGNQESKWRVVLIGPKVSHAGKVVKVVLHYLHDPHLAEVILLVEGNRIVNLLCTLGPRQLLLLSNVKKYCCSGQKTYWSKGDFGVGVCYYCSL